MLVSKVANLKVAGISACVPKYEVDNLEYMKKLFKVENDERKTKAVESLIKSTGIEKRRVCADKKTTSLELAVKAAENLFKEGSFSPEDFCAVVFVTESPDNLMPNNSSQAQSLLGLPENTAVLDINHACPGYIYGLWTSSLIANSLSRKVLLLVAETSSYFVSEYDLVTGPLFGDAGTATIIEQSTEDNEWLFAFETDGSKGNVLVTPGFGFKDMPSAKKMEYADLPDGGKRRPFDMYMDGQAVFNYVVQTVSKYFKEFMSENGKTQEDYDYLVLHQANAFMLKMLARSIGFPASKVPLSLNKYGNTNSVTIPLDIVSELKTAITQKSNRILMSGFGAGLATGIADIDLGPCVCPEVIEYE